MEAIELSIEKYSQILIYMTRRSIIYWEQQLSLLWGSGSPTIVYAIGDTRPYHTTVKLKLL